MKQPRNLKTRLISSVLVLVMMITSLLGTTFAWFTDLAVSGGNTIQVGSLKVGLYHKVGEDDWKSIKDDSNHKIFNYDKWEPGYTRFETLKIANHGNLALQYKLSIEVAGKAVTGSNGENLADVIDVYVVDGENTSSSSWTYKGTLTQVMRNPSSFINGQLLAREENVVSIALRMQTTAGNAYQGLDVGDIYVNLVATQWNYEKDSFDNPDYDKDSTFPELNIGGITVDVTTNYNNEVINTVPVSGEGVKATIPAGVKVDSGVNKLSLSVTEKEKSDANLTLNDGEALRSLDVHISGVSKDNRTPMLITVEKAMKVGLNMGNYTLYHVENGASNAMTAVDSLAELDAHNEFYYDPATGDVTLAMATFSEVAFVAETDPVWEGTVATGFAGGSGTEEDPYLIANADQLAYLGDLISNENGTYGDKYYKLVADINLGGEENTNKGIIFYPIGYHKVGGSLANVDLDDAPEFIYHEEDPDYAKNIVREVLDTESTTWYTYGGAFKGVFDGNGNTISNIYQNTWQMKGNYDGNYWNSAMGVFGYVYGGTVKNLTVDNFSSDGEFTPTGVIAAYAAGDSTFENIAITNCNPRVYNTGNGGIIGIAGSTTNANDDHIILKNITVDNSNKISALWGSWDVACGGLVGMYRGNVDGSGNATGDTIYFENCHVSAQIDVYNDVCANYQYYAYRYSGMIIGSVRHNTTSDDGRTIPNMAGISASGCTVHFGTWNDYYYCELVDNTTASYTHDYQMSRLVEIKAINGTTITYLDDTTGTVPASGRANYVIVDYSKGHGTENATCYHFKNGEVWTHDMGGIQTGVDENGDGQDDLREDKQHLYLEFKNLFTGYGWGVSSMGIDKWNGIEKLDVTTGDHEESVEKFSSTVNTLTTKRVYTLAEIFSYIEKCGVDVVDAALNVTIRNLDENGNVIATFIRGNKWNEGTISFENTGKIEIVIQDYFFCTPTTIIVNVTEHAHEYDNDCDTTCNECGVEREITHTPAEAVEENRKKSSCTENGSYDSVVYCSVCGTEISRKTITVDALGHSYNAVVTAPTCTTAGYTTYTCSVCGDTYTGNEVAATGHSYDAVVTAPTCTTAGYTTYTCSVCGDTYKGNEVAARGHDYKAAVTEPDCENDGYTTYTCSVCDDTYTDNKVVASGHSYDAVVTAPTCTTAGYTTYTCACGDTYVANETEALGHTSGEVKVENNKDSTCTGSGSYDNVVYCTVCNDELSRETIMVDSVGHSFTNYVSNNDATCEKDGTETAKCDRCDATDTRTDADSALGHSFTNYVSDNNASCTADGTKTAKCDNCDATDTVTVEGSKLKHSYTETETKAPTCTENGVKTYTCECGNAYTEEIEATGHSYEETVTAPTCTTEGHTTYTCACGDTYTSDEVAARGHDMVTDDAKAPTCTETGLTEGSHCSRCDHKVAQETVAAKGHTEVVDEAVAATCTTDGKTEGKHCSVCNEVLTAQTTVDALGHTEVVDEAVAATCTTTGLTGGKHCSVCNTVLVAQTTVAAKGHTEVTDKAVAPTCTATGLTEGKHCSVCNEVLTAQTTVAALGHITTNFTGDFLYRVGNQNTVQLSSLFNIGNRTVNIKGENVSGNVSRINEDTPLQFSGTGIITITLESNCTCDDCKFVLNLEVVDAVNATSATNATSNNVVLLNDCGFGSLEVSGGYTLYGNGFTMTCGSDSPALDMGYAFVTLNNGTLDNVQIVCPNFDYAVLYKSNMTESGNRSQTTDKTRYYNVKSGVMVSGNSQILNSRISGARAAVNVTGGNCVIDNSRIELGAVASLLIGSANSVTLRDVTLVQKPTASTYDSSKVLMGFSVLFVCDADGNTAPVTLEGTLVQNAWVNESDKQYVPSAGQSIISTVLGKTDYLHDIDGDGTKESLNLGFAYMPESLTSKVNTTTITDNRTNKNDIPYAYAEVSILNGKTYVYSYKNASGTDDSFKTESEYVPNKQGDNITVNYSDTSEGLTPDKSFGTDGWVYELNVDLDKASGYKLDFSKLSMTVNGTTVTDFKVNGSAKPAAPVAVTAGGVTYTLTATVNGKEYTATFKVTGTETSKESPSLVAANYEAGLCVASSYGGTWSGAAPALEGIQIKYWSVAEGQYKTIKLSDYTPTTNGQQNGTNTTWTYTPDNGDFTLTLTGGQVHSSNSVYAMPVVCDGKLYFVASKDKGLVNSGNSARTVPVSYTFKDNNGGDVLTFSHTWSVAENKDAQYKYSDFCNGTLTKLESSSGGGSCVTPDTLITLANGTQVRVDSLTGSEELLVWNMETGKLDKASIMFVDSDAEAEVDVIKLHFSDGTVVNVIYEHGFWDYDLNKYVYLDKNAEDYIGHTFAKQNGDSLEKVQLVDVVIETEVTDAWSPVTAGHLCYFVNGMLSMPGGVGGLFNIFDVNPETMTYDYEQMEKDIETYGLYTYEELNAVCPLSEDMFIAAGGAYLKISIGKGNLTEEELFAMINRYSKFFN